MYQADPVEEKKARVEEAQGEGEGEGEGGRAGGGTLAANVAGGRKSGRGRGGRGSRGGRGGRGAAPAAKARVKGAPVRLGAPLQLRPIWRPSLSSEDQAAAVVVSEFAATFLGGLLSARGIPPPSPTELHRALAAGAGRAGEAMLDALHMSLLQVLLEEENLAVDDAAVEPSGPGVAGAAVLKLADLLRFMSTLSWPELLRQAVLHWEVSQEATGKGEPPHPALLELAAVLGHAGYHAPGAVPSALRARALDALCELSLLSAALPGGPKVSAKEPEPES